MTMHQQAGKGVQVRSPVQMNLEVGGGVGEPYAGNHAAVYTYIKSTLNLYNIVCQSYLNLKK